jgi:hypothetical protein
MPSANIATWVHEDLLLEAFHAREVAYEFLLAAPAPARGRRARAGDGTARGPAGVTGRLAGTGAMARRTLRSSRWLGW